MLAKSETHPDSPLSFILEEVEISSGQTSPAETIVDNITRTTETNAPETIPQEPQNLIIK